MRDDSDARSGMARPPRGGEARGALGCGARSWSGLKRTGPCGPCGEAGADAPSMSTAVATVGESGAVSGGECGGEGDEAGAARGGEGERS